MLTRVLSLSPVLLGLMALAAAPAQSSPRTESFGTQDEGITIIGYREFFPEDSTIGWSGSLERSSGGFVLFASIDTIPNGAVLTGAVLCPG
jgi:hypothetical protein